jgi:ABC-2 type transport system permease protein
VRSLGLITLEQVDRLLVSELSLSQSLLLVWPQLVGLIAATVVIFAVAYISFMRQEVRA